ncbi:uncharacterized protein BXZ73DRAFT_104880 [Epithele typhae]|uniref:uncharacterized protein n=1 Tax=Epithele typhae TaxID=378194 RepID=UPI002008B746|nr:uncharacterized protein BXZ73DRAFT_104880 [Epithele typhae]KAH9919772.1 hypothetical protein BXZ73DRAFT_104880 [Epithele typhae]
MAQSSGAVITDPTVRHAVERLLADQTPYALEVSLSKTPIPNFKAIHEEFRSCFLSSSHFLDSPGHLVLNSLCRSLPVACPTHFRNSEISEQDLQKAVLSSPAVLMEVVKVSGLKSGHGRFGRSIRARPFLDWNLKVPVDDMALRAAERLVLDEQWRVLQGLLWILRQPDSSAQLVKLNSEAQKLQEQGDLTSRPGFTTVEGEAISSGPNSPSNDQDQWRRNDATLLSTFSAPISALPFGAPAEFGNWVVKLTANAVSDLRRLRQREKNLFEKVIAKLRDLSHGHFSSKNHAPVSDVDSGVPIYKARVDGSHRLVYHIDCPESREETISTQNIRIFGVYNTVFHTLLADYDLPFIAEPSPPEQAVIEHSGSCYVIGRSGTGKTLCIMYKIISIDRSWESLRGFMPRPRQLFVTRSRSLAEYVWSTVDKLASAFRLGDLSRHQAVALARERPALEGEEDTENTTSTRPAPPRRWSQLTNDAHFPLIITLDECWSMLERDVSITDDTGAANAAPGDEDEGTCTDDTALVSGKRFAEAYWKRLPPTLTKGFDPLSVFSEIVGVIEGSENTVLAPQAYLDREAYSQVSAKRYPTFASHRERIYDIFEKYRTLKAGSAQIDEADRTHALLRSVRKRLPGAHVDFLYVDEAQDNRTIDLLLLRGLCRNPNGLFWAGDTAQTIVVGSTFKFTELTSMLHTYEGSIEDRTQHQPEMFHLAVNYRSKSGITDCSREVVTLISKFWPGSVDYMRPEVADKEGASPLCIQLSTFDREFSDIEPLKLGADQCVIVRDEDQRSILKMRGIVSGLVITVYDSKGLEFDDLKCFYVALTRARNRVWIVDTPVSSNPLLMVLEAKDCVDIHCHSEDSPLPFISESGFNPQDWAKRGHTMMERQLYEHAHLCFERASLPQESSLAYAYMLRERAFSHSDWRATGDAFRSYTKKYCRHAGDTNLAVFLNTAAVCYARANAPNDSAEAYLATHDVGKACQVYCNAGMMEEARSLILAHRRRIPHDIFTRVCLFFFRDRSNAFRKAVEMFPMPADAVKFIEQEPSLRPTLADYYEDTGEHSHAARIHEELGHTLRAIDLYDSDPEDEQSINAGTRLLKHALATSVTIGLESDLVKREGPLSVYYDRAEARISKDFPASVAQEDRELLKTFLAISHGRHTELFKLGTFFYRSDRPDAALLALDYAWTYLRRLNDLNLADVVDEESFATSFPILLALLLKHEDSRVRKMPYGITQDQSRAKDSHTLPKGTYLWRLAEISKEYRGGESGARVLTGDSLSRLFDLAVKTRLKSEPISEIIGAIKTKHDRLLSPCVRFSLSGLCDVHDMKKCNGKHEDGEHPLNQRGLHHRIELCLWIIKVYGLAIQLGDVVAWKERVYWMRSLWECFQTPFFDLGDLSMFDIHLTPSWPEALKTLRQWLARILYIPVKPGDDSLNAEARFDFIPTASHLSYIVDAIQQHDTPPAHTTSGRNEYCDTGFLMFVNGFDRFIRRENATVHWKHVPGAFLYLKFMGEGTTRIESAFQTNLIGHLTEGLASAIVITGRYTRRNSELHNLELRRSWIVNLMELWYPTTVNRSPHDFPTKRDLINLIPRILERVRNASPTDVKSSVKHLGTALYFLLRTVSKGYAVQKEDIVHMLRGEDCDSFERDDFWFNVTDFVSAQGRIRGTNPDPAKAQSWDQIVQIKDSRYINDDPAFTHRNICEITYSAVDNLPGLLEIPRPLRRSRQVSTFPQAWLNARVASRHDTVGPAPTPYHLRPATSAESVPDASASELPSVPAEESVPVTSPVLPGAVPNASTTDATGEENAPASDVVQEEAVVDVSPDVSEVAPVSPAIRAVDADATIAEEAEPDAATAEAKPNEAELEPIDSKTAPKPLPWQEVFDQFAEHARTMTSPENEHYRRMCLGPAPHLSIAAQIMKAKLLKIRNALKKKMKEAQGEELGAMNSMLTNMNVLHKQADELINKVSLAADVHRNHDAEKLKVYVLEAEAMRVEMQHALSKTETKTWTASDSHMKLAIEGIVIGVSSATQQFTQ